MVKFSGDAKRDLKNIHDYIAIDSKNYAKKVATEIVEKTKILIRFPKLGRIVPELNNPNFRELFIYSYRIIYEISESDIEILAIIHFKQDFPSEKFENFGE